MAIPPPVLASLIHSELKHAIPENKSQREFCHDVTENLDDFTGETVLSVSTEATAALSINMLGADET
ncbi:MAG: hypothetical protein F6J95_006670 [Leptolyngbya sp. SIO1E4]|nr:hypothetical protein [Leptolyngbya sp. SIO1E4]